MNIRNKILIPMVVVTLLIAVMTLFSVAVIFSNYVEENAQEDIQLFADAAMSEFEGLFDRTKQLSYLMASNENIRRAFLSGSRSEIVAATLALNDATNADFITVTDPAGNVLVRAHEPDNFGDSVANQINIQRAMAGEQYTTIEQGSAVKLSVRAGAPVLDDAGNLLGIVSTGFRLDTDDFVDRIKNLTGAETTVFLGSTRISTTIVGEDGQRAVGTEAAENISRTVLAGNVYSGHAQVLGRDAAVNYMPLRDAGGTILGMLFVGSYTDVKNAAVRDFIFQGGGIALGLLLLAVVFIYFLTKRIVAPIHVMVRAANHMADGELDVSVEIHTRDELRSLADSFQRMIVSSRQQAEVIEAIAQGDLSGSVQLRGEKDVVGMALQKMLNLNNRVFSSINLASSQVASSAQQIADGAQNLAHGSTEQAGVVEGLSTSVSNVAALSSENADTANKAAELARRIRDNAEQGSEQMGNLTQAVSEINAASKAIGSVIKVIDDIAFQTNILALNAAVEAARAGEHGKGFAVVADEVRNLASKSAEAARDTSQMISNSIEKAELGAAIAANTARALMEIVEGINQSSKMVGEIAASAESASEAIRQINIGIDQVALVIQQNSATAEQSAASSEEMSSQSQLLREQVSQFHLREERAARFAANPYALR